MNIKKKVKKNDKNYFDQKQKIEPNKISIEITI